ncbi:hypothetical protein FRC00_002129 [Tulasnella sp. 408]|nr:hypothetical protein FRC00_002129 [Tulasnella sp. 408]
MWEERVFEPVLGRVRERVTVWMRDGAQKLWEQEAGQGRARALVGELQRKVEGELIGELAPELARELTGELTEEVAEEVGRALGQVLGRVLAQELAGVGALKLALSRARALDSALERALELALERALDRALGRVLKGVPDGALDGALGRALDRALDRVQTLSQDLAQRLLLESSIIRILLWAWKRTYGTQLDLTDKRSIFISSCRLWAPLERRVDFTINGIESGIKGERLAFEDRNRDKLLTASDLDEIVEFAEDLQKDRKRSEFIARNADVGINQLYVHFNRRVDWNYDLYDLREQPGLGIGMIW